MKQKKIIALVLALCLVFMLSVSAMAATEEPFTDITADHWAHAAITDVAQKGIFLGTAPKIFSADENMSIGMLATTLGRLGGADLGNNDTSAITGVPGGLWYTGALNWAFQNKLLEQILAQNPGKALDPNAGVTREQACVMMFQYAKAVGAVLPATGDATLFADDASISAYAKEAVLACQKAGLLLGDKDNNCNPQGFLSRAEMATILSRLATINNAITYNVSFEANGGSKVDVQKIKSGAVAVKPATPTKDQMRFDGWYLDKDFTKAYDFAAPVQSNFTLFAKWSTIPAGGTSSSSSGVRYPAPKTVTDPETLTAPMVVGFEKEEFTYTTTSQLVGSTLKISGAYDPREKFTGFEIGERTAGYVLPILFTAPSNYKTGDAISVSIKDGAGTTTTEPKAVTLDGENFFHLFLFVPMEHDALERSAVTTPKWSRVVTVDWGRSARSYTIDVAGMAQSVYPPAVGLQETRTTAEMGKYDLEGLPAAEALTYAENILVTRTDKPDVLNVNLYGSYGVSTSFEGYAPECNNGYVLALQFIAPMGPKKTSVQFKDAKDTEFSEPVSNLATDGSALFLYYVDADSRTKTFPIEVKWTNGPADTDPFITTYNLNVANMIPQAQGIAPITPTKDIVAQLNAADPVYKGIADPDTSFISDDLSLTASVISKQKHETRLALNGKFLATAEGVTVPGFGKLDQAATIVPLQFNLPANFNLGLYASTDVVLTITNNTNIPLVLTKDDLMSVDNEPCFVSLLRLNTKDINNGYANKYTLAWAGGFQETYTLKMGNISEFTAQSAKLATANDLLQLTPGNNADDFTGIAAHVVDKYSLAAPTEAGMQLLTINNQPIAKDTVVPGFGTLAKDGYIVPFIFRAPAGCNPETIAVTYTMTRQDKTKAEYTRTAADMDTLKNGEKAVVFFLQIDGDIDTAAYSRTFDFTWSNGFTESHPFQVALPAIVQP